MECLRLGPNEVSIDWMMQFFADPEIQASMPDGDRSMVATYRAARALEQGTVVAYAPIVDGKAIGLFWGTFMNDFCIYAHWGILKAHRKAMVATEACEVVTERFFEDFPHTTSVLGTISKNNLRSYAGALKAGFTVQGTIPKNHISNGTVYDSWIVIKERT